MHSLNLGPQTAPSPVSFVDTIPAGLVYPGPVTALGGAPAGEAAMHRGNCMCGVRICACAFWDTPYGAAACTSACNVCKCYISCVSHGSHVDLDLTSSCVVDLLGSAKHGRLPSSSMSLVHAASAAVNPTGTQCTPDQYHSCCNSQALQA